VIFTGILDSDEFHWLFSAVDVVILPYKRVSQSGVLNMCAAYDVPTITTDLERFSELHIKYGWPQTANKEDIINMNISLGEYEDAISAYKRDNGMTKVIQTHIKKYE
jgi:hypothetical protein